MQDQPSVSGTTARSNDPATSASASGGQDHVELRLPIDAAYLTVLRTATSAVAARLDFTLDDIEDLRIAVDEACALLLHQADPDGELVASFDLEADALHVRVHAPTIRARLPARDTFAWAVLSALVTEVDAGVDRSFDGSPDTVWVAMLARRSHR